MRTQVVSFNCVLKDSLGHVISSSFCRDVVTLLEEEEHGPRCNHGADLHGAHLRGLIEGLQNLRKGERRKLRVSADRGYGYYDTSLVCQVPRAKLPKGSTLAVGNQILTQDSDGEYRMFRVVEAGDRTVTLDGNHPLAGQDLLFEIEVTAVRRARPEDLAEYQRSRGGRLIFH